MWGLSKATRVFLRSGATDLRLGFDGLSALVKHSLQQDVQSGNLFVFCNRTRTRIKVLCFDGSGLWLCMKRLEKGTFGWPGNGDEAVEPAELQALLAGLDIERKRNWFRK